MVLKTSMFPNLIVFQARFFSEKKAKSVHLNVDERNPSQHVRAQIVHSIYMLNAYNYDVTIADIK